MRIVVFSGFNNRSVIAFLRTLYKSDIEYSIVAADNDDPILLSKYKNKVDFIRENYELNIDDIKKPINFIKNKYEEEKLFIAPSTEALNRFLLNNRLEFEKIGCIIPLVEKDLYEMISDKEAFCKLCETNYIKVPKIVEFKKKNIPFVVKPKKYYTKGKTYSPIIVNTEEVFEKYNKFDDDFYCQEYLSGKSYYLLYYFAKNGKINKLAQENFLQQSGGKSIIAAKMVDYEKIPSAEIFEKLFKSIGFFGLVMVEVRIQDNHLIMIEANPRFWGPSQLFVDYGKNLFVDFLKDWDFTIESNDIFYSDKYFWGTGIDEDVKDFGFCYDKITEFEKNDIYKRQDTINIYKKELTDSLIKKYKNLSKHSQYQILSNDLEKIITSDTLNIKSRAEKERFEYIQNNLDLKNKTLLDIGANTGYFSIEAISAGAKKVISWEGNKAHAQFLKNSAKLLEIDDIMHVIDKYYKFSDNKETYDICFLLNVLHHLGDDYGDTNLSLKNAKTLMIKELNSMAYIANQMVFQIGFNWKGDRNICLCKNGLKSELIEFIKTGIEDFWTIVDISVAKRVDNVVKYYKVDNDNIKRMDELGEFLNRPIFILKSKKV